VTGLIVGNNTTIQAINELFLNKNDQSALNKFITQAKWDEFTLNYRRVGLELERLYSRQFSAQAGRLIIDDTMAHHTKCAMDGLAYLHDHNLGHNVWAHNVVTSYYVNRSDQFPVDFRLYIQFNDWNKANREGLIEVEGRKTKLTAHSGDDGIWIKYHIMREDTQDGKIEINSKVTKGGNLMISKIVFEKE